MKTTILLSILALALSSCSSASKPIDLFDAAINASIGSIVGGIMGPQAGGVL